MLFLIYKSLNAFFEMCIFGGVLSDINYEYLLMKLCEIIDRNGFGVGWDFWNLKKFLKNFFIQKSVISGFGGYFLVYGVDLVSLMYFLV